MTRQRVRQLLDEGMTITEIAEVLALAKSTVSYHARRLGNPPMKKFAARYDWVAVRDYYEQGFSARDCRARFGFSSSAWHEAVHRGDVVLRSPRAELELCLVRDRMVSRGYLKRGLIREGLKGNACERCGVREWRGRTLSLALHHVNGDGTDNRLENIQILCPNCHAQTPNYGGLNLKGKRAA